ncbi:MAG: hypothetical protein OXN21_11960 [Chloroflexota bacterium]|nr:hypothetical protein [Chloroflexota bacterium]MDE2844082.1 hypothetical protein [Chloroflexota bacterium]
MGNAVWGIGEGRSSARACPVLDTGVSFLGNRYVREKVKVRNAARQPARPSATAPVATALQG